MSEPFIGEIRVFGFGYAPKGWAQCNGQLLAINQNQALFSLLGTYYGGNGTTSFGLPDLRGRTPVFWGNGISLGQAAGEEGHTLIQAEMPMHTHMVNASSNGPSTKSPDGALWANTADVPSYATGSPNATMNAAAISSAGGSQAHENRQPYLALNFCIATVGIYPSRN
jgi:microcystin-dependent protein